MIARLRCILPLAFLAFSGCGRPPVLNTHSGLAQGTTYSVQWWSESPASREDVANAVDAELQRLDLLLSNYRPDSEIERFNAVSLDTPQTLAAELVALLRIAESVHRSSGGCFDPTVRPLVALWGFDSGTPRVPQASAVAEARETVGFEHLEILDDTHVRKRIPGLAIDMSSLGQGYTVQRLALVLEEHGIGDYLVEIGGELMGRGHKPDGSSWRVGVEDPRADAPSTIRRVFSLPGEPALAMITSGVYRHFFDDDGRRYGHILDPRTGAPVEHRLLAATVIGQEPASAAAWGTALLCLGPDAGAAVAEREGLAALLMVDENGAIGEWQSPMLTELGLD